MKDQVLPEGTEVLVLTGLNQGRYATILSFEASFGQYAVQVEGDEGVWYLLRNEFDVLEEDLDDEDEGDEYETPGFGMEADEFAVHLEFLIGRALDKVPTVGPETAFFGYQEFEGLSAEEVLLSLLDKLEEGIAHLAQAHILISRIGLAYRRTMKEITGEPATED